MPSNRTGSKSHSSARGRKMTSVCCPGGTRMPRAIGPARRSSTRRNALTTSLLCEKLFDQLHQVLHDKTLFWTNIHMGTVADQVVGHHRTDGGHARPLQTLFQRILQAALPGHLEQPIHLRRTGEDDG